MVLLVLVVIVAGVAIVGGGNTVSGFGTDLERSGEKIRDVSQ